jgi:hypothetical protein
VCNLAYVIESKQDIRIVVCAAGHGVYGWTRFCLDRAPPSRLIPRALTQGLRPGLFKCREPERERLHMKSAVPRARATAPHEDFLRLLA